MKFFRTYLFPAFFGLLIYICIRLVNDVISDTKFWKRDWEINAIEIFFSVVVGYIYDLIVRHFVQKFSRQQYTTFTTAILLREFVVVYLFCFLVLSVTMIPMAAFTDDGLQLYDVININLIPGLFVLLYYAIARGMALLQYTYEQKVQIEKMQNDQLQTELKFLKAQYHPHFLFNALNTVYFQMDEDVAGAKKTLEKFSQLLRYQLYDQQTTVSVEREIAYLHNFIELQHIRSSSRLQLQVEIDESLKKQQIYPLLFLPLIENAFKYVGGDYHLTICLRQQSNGISLDVYNSLPLLDSTVEGVKQRSGGIGLDNLRRRLELLYPNAHTLELSRTDMLFKARLFIQTH
ncbi:histidine kinase [Cytophagaceae bacterium DM2B3-1]|uniref:Histidine kinase n=1 Tax=Xanthocytophaga flava TaxID=3048013 RepID=A0ABT7CRV4_9BACT|nr:histidine kinase [Xanthocytophaga flavus]MDJ1496483.1 histidine kinase [Xanthocytophaga flavus]